MEGKTGQALERWVPERILRGHLAGADLPDHLTPTGEDPAGSLMTLLDMLGGLSAASGVLAVLVGRARDGRGRRERCAFVRPPWTFTG